MAIQLPYTGGTTDETLPTPYTNGGGPIDFTLKEDKANKGVANGYAPLDANSKVPVANLPDQASLDAEVDGKITTHNSVTTSVHGIANTANLVLTSDSRLSDPRTPTSHSHAIADVTSLQTTLDGKALSSHTHAIANVTGLQTALDSKQASGSYAPTSHSHAISDVTNLQTTLDGKQASGSYAPSTGISPTAITGTAVVTNDSRLSDNRAPTAHAHAIADVTSLQTTLDGKASSSHTHTISDVTNLQSKLDTKQEYYYTPVTYASSYTIPSTLSDTGSIERHFHFTVSGTPTFPNNYINFPTTGKLGDIITITNSPIKTDGFANNVALLVRETNGTTNSNFGSLEVGTTQRYVRKSSNSAFGNWTYLTPAVHSHGNISNAGAIGSTANLPLITTTSGVVTTGSFGTTANSFCQGDDSRLSNSRTPTSHSHSISEVTSLQATLTAFAIALG